jgi:demethylmenaquinone methyltransferase/2-methoxy-6-polyprenyl-1,4-benzoquinol methylase
MLAVGEKRARERKLDRRVTFTEANAETLPFADASFDAVTIAFGIRNVPRIDQALAEAHRVLKPGGRFLCLEFSAVDVAMLDRVYEFYSFNVIPMIGGWVVGDEQPYRYLVESIRKFPNQARFALMIERAGFKRVTHRNLSGGIAAIHSGWKL